MPVVTGANIYHMVAIGSAGSLVGWVSTQVLYLK